MHWHNEQNDMIEPDHYYDVYETMILNTWLGVDSDGRMWRIEKYICEPEDFESSAEVRVRLHWVRHDDPRWREAASYLAEAEDEERLGILLDACERVVALMKADPAAVTQEAIDTIASAAMAEAVL